MGEEEEVVVILAEVHQGRLMVREMIMATATVVLDELHMPQQLQMTTLLGGMEHTHPPKSELHQEENPPSRSDGTKLSSTQYGDFYCVT